MDLKQAIKLAINSIEIQTQHLAFDANLYRFGEHEQNIPHIAKAYKTYSQLKEARQILSALSSGLPAKPGLPPTVTTSRTRSDK